MAGNITFTMIKPDAVSDNHIGGITQMIEEGGFRIVAMKKTRLSEERAGKFYEVHKERPFYNDLVKYMSKGPIVAMILEKDNAVEDFRTLIVPTEKSNVMFAAPTTSACSESRPASTAPPGSAPHRAIRRRSGCSLAAWVDWPANSRCGETRGRGHMQRLPNVRRSRRGAGGAD